MSLCSVLGNTASNAAITIINLEGSQKQPPAAALGNSIAEAAKKDRDQPLPTVQAGVSTPAPAVSSVALSVLNEASAEQKASKACLENFKKENPQCPIYEIESLSKLGKAMEGTKGRIFKFDETTVAKWTSNSLEAVLDNAAQMYKFKPHKNLNAFKGIVICKDCNSALFLFERVNGNTLEPLEVSRIYDGSKAYEPISFEQKRKIAMEMVKVFIHFEEQGYAYNDIQSHNVMLSTKGETVVIDYDLSFRCRYREAEEYRREQRDYFGYIFPEFESVNKKCRSKASMNEFGWKAVLEDLEKAKPPSKYCIIM